MARYKNGQLVELLAPAGTFEIFGQIVTSNCDAVYLGGKKLNMRLHRKGFNLEEHELAEAIKIGHALGKKIYVTLNNLHNQEDIDELKSYLDFLAKIQPDALIIQDLSVVKYVRDMGLPLALHASVMMDAHNLKTIRAFKELGISRVVVSRETPLAQIRSYTTQIDMEFEYFVHGDMCIAHGGQCLSSSFLFGQSSNRGRCMKPCRWNFKTALNGCLYQTEFPLAVKDMYLYEHIPELIDTGVHSFKIEGRMREADYIKMIVDHYGDAIDRYLSDPDSFDRKKGADILYANRKRDLTTFYAFGKTEDIINRRLEGTGAFYSTGKPFSTAAAAKPISDEMIDKQRAALNKSVMAKQSDAYSADKNNAFVPKRPHRPQLCIKVNSMQQALVCLAEKIDHLYLSGEVFAPDLPFSAEDIRMLLSQKGNSRIYLALPHMMGDADFDYYDHLLSEVHDLDGLLVTSLGAITHFKESGLSLVGDSTLNLYNAEAAAIYHELGLSACALSAEMALSDILPVVNDTPLPLEIIAFGSPTMMLINEDLFARALRAPVSDAYDLRTDHTLFLIDDCGESHPVRKDACGRCHMLPGKELSLLPLMSGLCDIGIERFRIEACHMDLAALKRAIYSFREPDCEMDFSGFTFGALSF